MYLAHGRDAVIVCEQHGMAFLLELLSALAHGLVSPLPAGALGSQEGLYVNSFGFESQSKGLALGHESWAPNQPPCEELDCQLCAGVLVHVVP